MDSRVKKGGKHVWMRKYPALEINLILSAVVFVYYYHSTGNNVERISLLLYIEFPALSTGPTARKTLCNHMLNGQNGPILIE